VKTYSAKLAANHSPVTEPKKGRMPLEEAAPHLKNEAYGRAESLRVVNKLSRQMGYTIEWTASYLQQRVEAGEIVLPWRRTWQERK
jgi:hypothetical protein